MTKKFKVSIGCDPELFLFNGDTPVSAHGLIPGTKWVPCEVPRGAIQVDGVAAEFNIHPAKNRSEFLRNVTHVQRILERVVKSKDPNLNLRAVPTVMFTQEYFDALPTETKALGCEPDFSAYTEKPNPKPYTTQPMRTGSGHVHIGWEGCNDQDKDYIQTVIDMVKELDFVLYRQSIQWDSDEKRMALYGTPGSFRFKPYGLEYRVLSNAWLNDTRTMKFVYDAAKNVASRVLKGERFSEKFSQTHKPFNQFLAEVKLPIVENYLKEV